MDRTLGNGMQPEPYQIFYSDEEFRQHLAQNETPLRFQMRSGLDTLGVRQYGPVKDQLHCVVVLQNGKVCPTTHMTKNIDPTTVTVTISEMLFFVVYGLSGKKNDVATKLFDGLEVHGPVTFIPMNAQFLPTHISVATFNKHVISLLR